MFTYYYCIGKIAVILLVIYGNIIKHFNVKMQKKKGMYMYMSLGNREKPIRSDKSKSLLDFVTDYMLVNLGFAWKDRIFLLFRKMHFTKWQG